MQCMSHSEFPPPPRHGTAPPAPPPPPAPATRPAVPPPANTPKARKPKWRTILIAVLGGVIGSGLTAGFLWWSGVFEEADPVAVPPPVETVTTTTVPAQIVQTVTITPLDGNSRVSAVAARAIPSIVTVEVGDNVTVEGADGTTRTVYSVFATGSGVVFRSDGFILTNNHVVEDSVITKVVFSDGRRFEARIVGTDPLTDIAVLEIDADELPVIDFADISGLAIGDEAIAVGSPLGLEGGPSVTAGVVSAFNRQLTIGPGVNDSLYGLIQTDAPITLGSSGGALLNGQAQLIGITTAIGVSDVGAEGLGFAVPVDMVERLAADLIADGFVRHAYLGIGVDDAMTVSAQGAEVPSGAAITGFAGGSAIQLAGAEVDDVIVAIEERPIATTFDLLSVLRSYRAGDQIAIVVERGGETIQLDVELGLRPDDP